MPEHIPNITITTLENGNQRLEDENYSANAIIDLHPIQIRLLAERVGLISVEPPCAEDKPTVAEQARDIDRLKRNMLRVREYAMRLQREFATGADWEHADLSFEMGRINALVDLLDMAVDDFADDYTACEPDRNPTAPEPAKRTACTPSPSAPVAPMQLELEG
ncbi:MAG: hypothetical protein KXJ61_10970 [Hydrogenophaga sp.]|jgi:hypothetical protein|uniref:hypothetical protein n=1 Tax=Hydrogenophaga sp. TaxID=1904254 RepID=UPI001D4E5EF1|nr:hypothetical protein [Hydrogenophaga sp.]MBW0170736.1 hypothetical protein [Hydrogenophaga sp.]MBW0185592.1 hypothetical protein [Hydrogenophaga sp.]